MGKGKGDKGWMGSNVILVDDYTQLQSLSDKKPIISKAKNRPSGGGACWCLGPPAPVLLFPSIRHVVGSSSPPLVYVCVCVCFVTLNATYVQLADL